MKEPIRISIRWEKRGDKARSPTNPAYPGGVTVDLTAGATPCCPVPLPYPAKEVGTYWVFCRTCGFTAAVTAAGRADDPREVRLPCKALRETAGNA